jgi:hypothetical protein
LEGLHLLAQKAKHFYDAAKKAGLEITQVIGCGALLLF